MRKLQQLPKLSCLVVVEHGLLGGGKKSEVSQALLPDGGGARAPRIWALWPFHSSRSREQVSVHMLVEKSQLPEGQG